MNVWRVAAAAVGALIAAAGAAVIYHRLRDRQRTVQALDEKKSVDDNRKSAEDNRCKRISFNRLKTEVTSALEFTLISPLLRMSSTTSSSHVSTLPLITIDLTTIHLTRALDFFCAQMHGTLLSTTTSAYKTTADVPRCWRKLWLISEFVAATPLSRRPTDGRFVLYGSRT